jgi:predicted chitinase
MFDLLDGRALLSITPSSYVLALNTSVSVSVPGSSPSTSDPKNDPGTGNLTNFSDHSKSSLTASGKGAIGTGTSDSSMTITTGTSADGTSSGDVSYSVDASAGSAGSGSANADSSNSFTYLFMSDTPFVLSLNGSFTNSAQQDGSVSSDIQIIDQGNIARQATIEKPDFAGQDTEYLYPGTYKLTVSTRASAETGSASANGSVQWSTKPIPLIVTNSNGDGPGSFNWMVDAVNRVPVANGPQQVTLAPSVRGSTIALKSHSPFLLRDQVTISGPITLNGSSLSSNQNYAGVAVFGSHDTVSDITVTGFSQYGIEVQGTADAVLGCTSTGNVNGIGVAGNWDTIGGTTSNSRNLLSGNSGWGLVIVNTLGQGKWNTVLGNLIGTDASGTAASPNLAGILVDGAGNTIGGTSAGAGNVISGNSVYGIGIGGLSGVNGNVIEGNFIGTDISGTKPLGNTKDGIDISNGASDNTIGGTSSGSGNVISANGQYGELISGSTTSANTIQGNEIGLDVSGTTKLGNAWWGIMDDDAPDTVIGGSAKGAGNVISGNTQGGLGVGGLGATGIEIQGNTIGLARDGVTSLGNGYSGILLAGSTWSGADGAPSNISIGGTALSDRNVISSNGNYGIWISDPGTSKISVLGNLIGTDATGTLARGNAASQILVGKQATNVTIGGTSAGAGNIIAGNKATAGLVLDDVHGVIVQGNRIGTDVTAKKGLPNREGILISDGSADNVIGLASSDMPVDLAAADAAGNEIGFNLQAAVWVQGDSTKGNSIRANSVFGNGQPPTGSEVSTYNSGIDLGGDGRTVNQSSQGDSGTGPNGGQQYPVSTVIRRSPTQAEISGTLNGTPGGQFTIDFYSHSSTSTQGIRQAKTYLGSVQCTVSSSGVAEFDIKINTSVDMNTPGTGFSVTATGQDGTSEIQDVDLVSLSQLQKIMPTLPVTDAQRYLRPLNEAMEQFQINTPKRAAAFLAQVAYESHDLTKWSETPPGPKNLKKGYQLPGNKRPPLPKTLADASAWREYWYGVWTGPNPNHIYDQPAKGLENTQPGDGATFYGRGPIQITGRGIYTSAGKALGLNLVVNYAWVADKTNHPEVGLRASAYWWTVFKASQKRGGKTLAQWADSVNPQDGASITQANTEISEIVTGASKDNGSFTKRQIAYKAALTALHA